jgi:enterochelin esterase family protein
MRRGRVVLEEVDSLVLRGNPLGDPHRRRVPVYLPPSYDDAPDARYPSVYVLAGFTGRGRALLNDAAWSPPLDERMDALIDSGRCGEMILVMPDCFTRLGGSQYIDSSATGRYGEHLARELPAWIDARYRTIDDRDHRGVVGKSSGGYGALVHGLLHSDVFGAVACHSGDMYFDYCYRGDVPKFCSSVQQAGGLESWLKAFEARPQKKHDDHVALNILAMAAAYSPHPAAKTMGIDLPCDLESGEFRSDVWERWLEHDPIRLLERHADALRSLHLLYLDCGTRDEWSLHLGARLLVQRLRALGIAHEHQEFDDGHMNVSYRYEVSLPKLGAVLGAKPA